MAPGQQLGIHVFKAHGRHDDTTGSMQKAQDPHPPPAKTRQDLGNHSLGSRDVLEGGRGSGWDPPPPASKHWKGRRGGSRGGPPLLLRCTALLIHHCLAPLRQHWHQHRGHWRPQQQQHQWQPLHRLPPRWRQRPALTSHRHTSPKGTASPQNPRSMSGPQQVKGGRPAEGSALLGDSLMPVGSRSESYRMLEIRSMPVRARAALGARSGKAEGHVRRRPGPLAVMHWKRGGGGNPLQGAQPMPATLSLSFNGSCNRQ